MGRQTPKTDNGAVQVVTFPDASTDAFGRNRVSLPKLQFSAVLDTSERPLFWCGKATGTGTYAYNATKGLVTISAPADGDVYIRQTKEYFTYRAAQSQNGFITFIMDGDDDNDEVALVVRSSTSGAPVDDRKTQAEWNRDKINGLGTSGHTLKYTAMQILVTDLQALFAGRVRAGFDIDGVNIVAHEFDHANILNAPYIRHARLPLRYEIRNVGGTVTQRAGYFDDENGIFFEKVTTAATTMDCLCAAAVREGGSDEPGLQRTVKMASTYAAPTVMTTLMGIRLRSTDIRAQLRPLGFEGQNIGGQNVEMYLLLNPEVSGTPGAWTRAGEESVAEVVIHNGAVTVDALGHPTKGVLIETVYLGASGGSAADPASDVPLGDLLKVVADVDGASDILWLAAKADSSTSAVKGRVTFQEIR